MRSKAPLLSAMVVLFLAAAVGGQSNTADLIKRADVNGDGVVDRNDVAVVRAAMGRQCGQTGYNPNADVNVAGGDCRITIDDSNFVSQFIGNRVPPPPTISASATPVANGAGWNKTDVTIHFTCSNAVSCPSDISVSTEGANQQFTRTATGQVTGTSASATVTLNIDKTAPVVQITSPANNSSSSSPVAVQGSFSAGGSPVTSATCNGAAAAINGLNFSCDVPLNTGSNPITARVTDTAGNEGSATVNVSLATTTPPTIQASINPPANAAGWNNTNVTVHFTCTNATSCPADAIVSTEGAGQVISGTATGAGGSTDTSVTLNIDKTAPAVQITSPANNSSSASPVAVAGNFSAGGSPIASATCNGAAAAINGLNFTCAVPLNAGSNPIVARVTDTAGNEGSATVNVSLATTATPTIQATSTPAPNGAGWNRTDVTVHFTCTNTDPNGCPSDVIVSTEGDGQTITGTATGPGGSASASVTLKIDKTAPGVLIESPANNSTQTISPVAVSGTVSAGGGSPLGGVTCKGAPATLNGSAFSCSVALVPGGNQIDVVATDVAGNSASASRFVTFPGQITAQGPGIFFTSPSPLTVFNGQQIPITVSGTIDDTSNPPPTVIVTSPESSAGVPAAVQGTRWIASGIPLREGNNLLTATGTNSQGGVSTTTLTVVMDTTAPIIRIDNPPASANLTNGQIAVSGVVNDIVAGTVNSEQVTVQVNGLDAVVSNRSFIVSDLRLARGLNTLTAIATDRAGNQAQSQIQVTLQDDVQQQRITMVSGDQQGGVIGTTLQNPLVVQLLNSSGAPVPNRAVTFEVVKSDGTLRSGDQQVQQLVVTTDDRGNASTAFTLGTRSGVGNNQVSAAAPGFAGSVVFSESASVGPPRQVNIVSGNDQRGPVGQPLTLPFIVIVADAGGNPVENVPIDFKILQGGGSLGTVSEVVLNTNSDGKSTAQLTLGQNEGVNNNVVAVGFGGDPATLGGSQRVTFQATGLVPGNPTETRVSGVVLDNADVPIPNATATIVGTQLQARTDAQGRFSIAPAPVGTVTLIVDGSTSTRPETFPFLAFVLNSVAGVDNTLGMPIYIPPLDINSAQLVGGDEEVVLTMAGVPGVAFTVPPHSTTLPDGRREPVRMMLSQVHADKVPMPPVNGSAPSLVWTLQPAGVHFNGPIRVQLPNTDGMSPGQVVEIYQFDHDLEQFVSTGPARVSPDGSVIVSDPGFGITKSGWGAPQPPPPPKNCTASCNDQNVCTADSLINPPCVCQNPPANDGAACGDEPGANSCKEKGICQGGACSGQSKPANSSCDDNVFCTESDKCDAGGGCKGTPIPEKQGPNVTVEIKFDWVKAAIENYISKFLPIKNTSITFSSEGNEKDICCEAKQQKDVAIKTVKWAGNIKVETDKLFIPALSFNIKVVKIGVFAKFGVGLQIFLQGENDFCQGNGICWSGGIQLAGNIEFGVAAEDAAKVVSISASCQSGLQLDANVSCKEYQIGLSSQPVKCKINVELFDGFVAFGLEKELYPSVQLIGGQKNPLPEL